MNYSNSFHGQDWGLVMTDPYLFEEVIRFSDCDPAGICYFGRFSTFFDESFIALARDNGIGWQEHETYNFLLPIVETNTKFYYPLYAGDTAQIYAGITRIGSRSFQSSHIITVDRNGKEQLVAKGFISRVTVDYDTFKPHPIAEQLKGVLQQYFFDEAQWAAFEQKHSDR